MKIILANPRGFCAGVNMAIESLERALDLFGAPVYVYHEIVHNKHVVERFKRRGVVFVEALEEVPEGSPLLYSAHGVSPEIRQESAVAELRAIDATCPLVTKVHLEAVKYAKLGYTIILIGHEGHDEVIGTMGEAPERMILVESVEDVERLEFDPEKLAYLTQTTLSVDDANVDHRRPAARSSPRSPTRRRTTSATPPRTARTPSGSWPRRADVVLVLGSQNSSNSQRLAEIAATIGHARPPDRRRLGDPGRWFEGVETVLITAGASAPEDVVQECITLLQDRFGATHQRGGRSARRTSLPAAQDPPRVAAAAGTEAGPRGPGLSRIAAIDRLGRGGDQRRDRSSSTCSLGWSTPPRCHGRSARPRLAPPRRPVPGRSAGSGSRRGSRAWRPGGTRPSGGRSTPRFISASAGFGIGTGTQRPALPPSGLGDDVEDRERARPAMENFRAVLPASGAARDAEVGGDLGGQVDEQVEFDPAEDHDQVVEQPLVPVERDRDAERRARSRPQVTGSKRFMSTSRPDPALPARVGPASPEQIGADQGPGGDRHARPPRSTRAAAWPAQSPWSIVRTTQSVRALAEAEQARGRGPRSRSPPVQSQ